MDELFKLVGATGGGAIIVVVAYLKILVGRLDSIQDGIDKLCDKVDKLDDAVMDHEVRIRVIESTKEKAL